MSPLESLVKFSKEKMSRSKKIEVEKTVAPVAVALVKTQEKPKLKEEINKSRLGVPPKVADTKAVEKAAEFASNATGVRKNFIMGLLTVESDLGRNTGECSYKEVEDGARENYQNGILGLRAWETFKDRREKVKDLATSLGYDYEKLQVSCNPGEAYVGTGGAMGLGQFMPDTWLEYKDRISQVVGKSNPDPWNEKDAAVAIALKLSDVYGVTDHNRYAEKNAAKLYLSGTTSWKYDWYANQILYWAENYHQVMG